MHLNAGAKLVVVFVCFFTVAGCGDEDRSASEEDEVRQVAQAYVDALAAEDAEAACQYHLPDDPNCVEATTEEFEGSEAIGADFGQVRRIRIEGDIARADFSKGGFFVLSRTSEGWRIGAPADEAETLGAPPAPKGLKPCTPEQLEKLRKQEIPVKGDEQFCHSQ